MIWVFRAHLENSSLRLHVSFCSPWQRKTKSLPCLSLALVFSQSSSICLKISDHSPNFYSYKFNCHRDDLLLSQTHLICKPDSSFLPLLILLWVPWFFNVIANFPTVRLAKPQNVCDLFLPFLSEATSSQFLGLSFLFQNISPVLSLHCQRPEP